MLSLWSLNSGLTRSSSGITTFSRRCERLAKRAHKLRHRSTGGIEATFTCSACQFKICCLPRDSSCLTGVVTGSWCFMHTQSSTHSFFSYWRSLSSIPAHNGHTPARTFSNKNISEGQQSFSCSAADVLGMFY